MAEKIIFSCLYLYNVTIMILAATLLFFHRYPLWSNQLKIKVNYSFESSVAHHFNFQIPQNSLDIFFYFNELLTLQIVSITIRKVEKKLQVKVQIYRKKRKEVKKSSLSFFRHQITHFPVVIRR